MSRIVVVKPGDMLVIANAGDQADFVDESALRRYGIPVRAVAKDLDYAPSSEVDSAAPMSIHDIRRAKYEVAQAAVTMQKALATLKAADATLARFKDMVSWYSDGVREITGLMRQQSNEA